MQVVRKGKLLVRFKTVAAALNDSRGILGQVRLSHGSARKLTEATFCSIGEACTSRLRPPYRPPCAPKACVHASILQNDSSAIKMCLADACADEQVAGRLLRAPKDHPPQNPTYSQGVPEEGIGVPSFSPSPCPFRGREREGEEGGIGERGRVCVGMGDLA